MENTKGAKILEVSDLMFKAAINKLYCEIQGSNRKFDVITGIPRGGIIPAVYLSHQLELPFAYYEEIMRIDLGAAVLFVDDCVDTGKTMKQLQGKLWPKDAVATVALKPWSIFKPDFYAFTTEDWLKFPWEIK